MSENKEGYKTESSENSGELKRCPFCGCEKVERSYDDYNRDVVICWDCGGKAIWEYWNNRPVEDALNTRVKEFESDQEFLIEDLDSWVSSLRRYVKKLNKAESDLAMLKAENLELQEYNNQLLQRVEDLALRLDCYYCNLDQIEPPNFKENLFPWEGQDG
jgi:hypothetical protein